jgi:hypothetical protein
MDWGYGRFGYGGIQAFAGNTLLKKNFRYSGISFSFHINKTIVEECIRRNSNDPFWESQPGVSYACDLRNPIYQKELEYVQRQMGIKDDRTLEKDNKF